MASSAPAPEPAPSAGPDPVRVGELVLAAAGLDAAERTAYLVAAAAGDPALRAEVVRRLDLAAGLPETFLAIPAAELLTAAAVEAPDDPAPELPAGGDRYERLKLAGEGGMARVYKAWDRQLARPVALKILDRGEPGARRRFLAEAQAQARVRHDNVLEVYETGTLDGQPFIAMRWVEGAGLMAVRGETSLEQQVRLVAQVAEGLHAAHRDGLVHRDVKPSNVLVEKTADGDWKPWVADFGIAQRWSGGEEARPAGLAGTPAYLAPELLQGKGAPVDRRADVWSLGVTLYELLTGARPFQAGDVAALLRQVAEAAPPPPRRLVPSLPAELEAIVLRCLEKDPERRYPSARALAEDLRRFLVGEVVEAHAATLAYRWTKFALRHRRLLAVAGVAGVLLAAALLVAAVLGLEARRANRRAELRRGQAEDLIGFMLTDLRDRLDPLGKLELLDGVGERAMRYFAAVPERELSDAELARRSQALYQIGDVRIRQGDLASALPPLAESLALAQALVERAPGDPERLFGLGQSHFWVGHVHWERGDLARARPHFERYLDLSRRLVALRPESLDDRLELSYALSNLGSVERQQGRLGRALDYFRRTLAVQQGLVARDPSRLDWRFEVAATRDLLGATLLAQGRPDEALPHLLAQAGLLRDLVARDPENFRFREFLGTSHDSLETWYESRGRLAEALAHARAAEEVFAPLAARDPANQLWRWQLGLARVKRAHLLALSGRPEAGRAALAAEAEVAAHRAALDPADRKWRLLAARAQVHLGEILLGEGRYGEARERAQAAVSRLAGSAAPAPATGAASAAADADDLLWRARALLLLGRAERGRGAGIDPVPETNAKPGPK